MSKRKKVDVYPAINDTDKENSLTHNYQPENTTHSTEQTNQSSTLSVRSISPPKEKFKKKVKALQQKLRRNEKKISFLKDMISHLQSKNYLTTDAATVLSENFSGLSYEIIKNQFLNQNVNPKGHRYNDEVKKFALTFHFYSPRAYNFLQPMLCLPAARSISHRTSSVNCDPGLFHDVFAYLGDKKKKDVNFKYCALIIDAMAIKNSITYDKSSGHYIGFCDFGKDIIVCEPDTPATEALVFMLVGLRGHWKTPIGYVLSNKVKASDLTSSIENILNSTLTYELYIKSITFDGTSTNLNSVIPFGCQFGKDIDNIVSTFSYNNQLIHIFLDPCHMLKLARNSINELGVFIDGDGQYIKWSYIKALGNSAVKRPKIN